MRRCIPVALIGLLGLWATPYRASGQTASTSGSNSGFSAVRAVSGTDDSPSWLFPVARLDESLPDWIRIGGQYRNRLEGPTGLGYTSTRDFYLLDRLRVHLTIRPKDWLRFHAEVQDARIFFNHHIPNANPYQDTWTLWEGYVQIGSSTAGWMES